MNDIIEHFKDDKKTNADGSSDLSKCSIGNMMADIWKTDSVKPVMRADPKRKPGKDKNGRQFRSRAYPNIKRIVFHSSCDGLSTDKQWNELLLMKPKCNNWIPSVESEFYISFIKILGFTVDGHRATVEVHIEKDNTNEGTVVLTVVHMGNVVNLEDMFSFVFGSSPPSKLPKLSEKVELALRFVDSSHLCRGFEVKDGTIRTMLPHHVGEFHDLKTHTKERRAISGQCSVFGPLEAPCSKCSRMRSLSILAKKRMEEKEEISRLCNFTYMTREELVESLIEERRVRRNVESKLKKVMEKIANMQTCCAKSIEKISEELEDQEAA